MVSGVVSELLHEDTYAYSSAWKDLLTSYNGQTITYDTIGNPTTYRGRSLTWDNVRRLRSYGSNTFVYNASGIRYQKNNITYILDGNRIVQESDGTKTLTYYYGTNGVIGFNYNGEDYYYRKNLQGDVITIFNSSGSSVAGYEYDAWGRVLKVKNYNNSNIGDINPFRYRSYYYDVETGLYYVSSRYYDPEIGRWINTDNQLSTGDIAGISLFAYCGNNSVNRIDPTGEAWYHWAIGAAIVAACAVATVVTCGGFAAAAGAVAAVGSGVAAATTASTIAAGAFIGSATVFGAVTMTAASTSDSVEEFCEQGNWGTVAMIATGGIVGGIAAMQLPSSNKTIQYPPNNGFNDTPRNSVLEPGSLLQRFGGPHGSFVAPMGTAPGSLSLPPDKIGATMMQIKVLESIPVQAGTAMPWFGQPGGGTQFLLPATIQELVSSGKIQILP